MPSTLPLHRDASTEDTLSSNTDDTYPQRRPPVLIAACCLLPPSDNRIAEIRRCPNDYTLKRPLCNNPSAAVKERGCVPRPPV